MSDSGPERVSDELARLLLERATVLDQSGLTLDHLRQAAAEAGISVSAFDDAVDEWRHANSFDGQLSQRSWPTQVLCNVAAGVVGWAALGTLVGVATLMGAPGLSVKLSEPVGLAMGAILAARLRARTALIVLSGLTLSQGAEVLMDALAGKPAVHGAVAHVALMLTGVIGVWVGATLSRKSGGSRVKDSSTLDRGNTPSGTNVARDSHSPSDRRTIAPPAKEAWDCAALRPRTLIGFPCR